MEGALQCLLLARQLLSHVLQALCELLETCTLPLKQHVQQQLEHLEGTKLPDLRTQNEQLLARIAELEQRGGR